MGALLVTSFLSSSRHTSLHVLLNSQMQIDAPVQPALCSSKKDSDPCKVSYKVYGVHSYCSMRWNWSHPNCSDSEPCHRDHLSQLFPPSLACSAGLYAQQDHGLGQSEYMAWMLVA